MPIRFRKTFIAKGAVAHVRKRPCGKNTVSYEIRYRSNGYNITVSSTDLDTAKEKFINAVSIAFQSEPTKAGILNFENIAEEWFSCRKGKITKETYYHYHNYYERYIYPLLKGKNIKTIRSAELVKIVEQSKNRTRVYEDLRSILNQIFNYAFYNGIIMNNPVKFVEFIKFERKCGEALTNDEIKYFLQQIQKPEFDKYRTAFLLELYFGLRPCEVPTARIDGEFIVARNAKRKKAKIEYKRIPFSQMAKKQINYIPDNICGTEMLNIIFKRIFPNKTQYYLRHTFSSKCQEFVRQEIVNIWLGDSPDKLIGKTYTHFSDEFMLSEMKKVIY